MKFYIDCVSGYSILVNSINNEIYGTEDTYLKNVKLCDKFIGCFTKGMVESNCGRNVIELQVLLKNVSEVMESLKDDEFTYRLVRKVLDMVLSGITSIPGNCADDSDSYKPKPKKISRIKKPSVKKNTKANFEWSKTLQELTKGKGDTNTDVLADWPDYDLEYCEQCNQMTNHFNGVCQKCK